MTRVIIENTVVFFGTSHKFRFLCVSGRQAPGLAMSIRLAELEVYP